MTDPNAGVTHADIRAEADRLLAGRAVAEEDRRALLAWMAFGYCKTIDQTCPQCGSWLRVEDHARVWKVRCRCGKCKLDARGEVAPPAADG